MHASQFTFFSITCLCYSLSLAYIFYYASRPLVLRYRRYCIGHVFGVLVVGHVHKCQKTSSPLQILYILWLLLAKFIPSTIVGSPVLGYLAAGILIGPYGLSIIRNVHATKAIAEFGVVFLLFNIGLEVKPTNYQTLRYKSIHFQHASHVAVGGLL